jgi:hypothetical protein
MYLLSQESREKKPLIMQSLDILSLLRYPANQHLPAITRVPHQRACGGLHALDTLLYQIRHAQRRQVY